MYKQIAESKLVINKIEQKSDIVMFKY